MTFSTQKSCARLAALTGFAALWMLPHPTSAEKAANGAGGVGDVVCAGTTCPQPCTADELAQIRQPASDSLDSVDIRCSATLSPQDTIGRRLDFGPNSSGVVFDCNGATLANAEIGRRPFDSWRILVRSSFDNKTRTGRQVSDVTIKNCNVHGSINIGSGMNEQTLQESSFTEGHTARLQSIAATRITLHSITITAEPLRDQSLLGNLLYLSPGVTQVTFTNSKISGSIKGVPVYLDAETAKNVVRNSTFAVITMGREIVAVDGSSDNTISDNTFINPTHGAIYIYRNCGERGTVRQNEPRRNLIQGNVFKFGPLPDHIGNIIWVASREKGKSFRSWCDLDKGHGVGSSVDDSDHARDNRIIDNTFINVPRPKAIVLDDPHNTVRGNSVELAP